MTDSAADELLPLPPAAGHGSTRSAGVAARARSYDAVALVLRLALGSVILPHGAGKVLGMFGGRGLEGTIVAFREGLGLPAVVAILVAVAEFCGALGLLAGLLTRLSGLGIGAVMVGAILLRHAQHGFFMNWRGDQAGEGVEYHLLVLGLALGLALGGGGAWSLDARLARWRRRLVSGGAA